MMSPYSKLALNHATARLTFRYIIASGLCNRLFDSSALFFSLHHDDVIKWKHFPRYWPFVRGFHRSPVNSPRKGQWRGALMFSLICVGIKGWVNNHEVGDLRCYRAHYDVIVMINDFLMCLLGLACICRVEHQFVITCLMIYKCKNGAWLWRLQDCQTYLNCTGYTLQHIWYISISDNYIQTRIMRIVLITCGWESSHGCPPPASNMMLQRNTLIQNHTFITFGKKIKKISYDQCKDRTM